MKDSKLLALIRRLIKPFVSGSYRIVKNDLGYYPQYRKILVWHKIAKHNIGFGLYPANDYDYPKTFTECQNIITAHKEWLSVKTKMTVVVNVQGFQ